MAAIAAQPPAKKQIPIVCPGHTRPLAELQFCRTSDDRTVLASACHDKLPMLRDGSTGDWVGTWRGHKGAVWSCRLDTTGSLAVTASGDYSVRLWDAITGEAICSSTSGKQQPISIPHQHIVKVADLSPNGDWLATAGHEGVLRVFAMEQVILGTADPPQPVITISHDGLLLHKLCWWDDSTIVTGASDGVLRWYTTKTTTTTSTASSPHLLHSIDTKSGHEIRDMELVPLQHGQRILAVASGDAVFFYEYDKLLKTYTMPIHFRNEGGVSLHPDGTQFIAGGSDLWVRVFDYATGAELACLKGHHGPIRCLRYSPTGTVFATGSEDGTIRLWDNTTL